MTLWTEKNTINKEIQSYTVGNDYILDKKLIYYDCKSSITHVNMLFKIDLITEKEKNQLIKVLNQIIDLSNKGIFVIKKEDEDCHTAIEKYLIKKLGDTGKKIHIGRSRNDQVLTALRLFYYKEIKEIIKLSEKLIHSFKNFEKKYGKISFPGYTHMQKAMPSSVKLWTTAFTDSMQDNIKLLKQIQSLTHQSPLGSAAGYNSNFNIDKEFSSKKLGFKNVQKNPIYVQNSRGKFESSIIHSLNQIMFDLNKIASDIIFFSLSETAYFSLSEKITTGSSIMPHKKNPDILEIIRANYHKSLSYEFQIKSIISNLISGYNRDIQLTKEAIINCMNLVKDSLSVMIIVISYLKANNKNCKMAMTTELFSTEEINEKIKQGFTFRDAYHLISEKYKKI